MQNRTDVPGADCSHASVVEMVDVAGANHVAADARAPKQNGSAGKRGCWLAYARSGRGRREVAIRVGSVGWRAGRGIRSL